VRSTETGNRYDQGVSHLALLRDPLRIVALLLLGFAGVFLFISALPYAQILRLARLATGGKSPLSPASYVLLAPRVRFAAAFCALLASLAWFLAGAIRRLFRQTLNVSATFMREVPAALRAWWAGQSGAERAVLGGILALAGVLRVAYLAEPIRYDESFSYVGFGRRSIVHALASYPEPNNHIFHSLLLFLCARIFGNSLWAIRLPALVAGWLAVAVTYMLARKLYGSRVAVLASALAATSAQMVLYSVNARGYSLIALFTLLLFLIATEIVERDQPAHWAIFSLVAIVGWWTVPVMVFGYASAVLWMFLCLAREDGAGPRRMKRWVAHCVVSAVAIGLGVVTVYLPPLVVNGYDALLRNPWVAPLDWATFWQRLPLLPGKIDLALDDGLARPLAWLLLGCLGVSVWKHRQLGSRMSVSLFFPVVIASGALVLLERQVPYARVFLFVAPLYAVEAAAGMLWLWRQATLRAPSWRDGGALALALLAAVFGTVETVSSKAIQANADLPQAREIAHRLAGQLRPGDALVGFGFQVCYYLLRQGKDCADPYAVKAPARVFTVVVDAEENSGGAAAEQIFEGGLYPAPSSFASLWRELRLDPRLYDPREKISSYEGVSIYRSERASTHEHQLQ
jgi:hypothetical protein